MQCRAGCSVVLWSLVIEAELPVLLHTGSTGGRSGSESLPRPFLVGLWLVQSQDLCGTVSLGGLAPKLKEDAGIHSCALTLASTESWDSDASSVLFPSLEQIMIYLFFVPVAQLLLTKGEEAEMPASLSSHCSTISAALTRGFVSRNSPQRPDWSSSLLT